jgi:hypothetical protein
VGIAGLEQHKASSVRTEGQVAPALAQMMSVTSCSVNQKSLLQKDTWPPTLLDLATECLMFLKTTLLSPSTTVVSMGYSFQIGVKLSVKPDTDRERTEALTCLLLFSTLCPPSCLGFLQSNGNNF